MALTAFLGAVGLAGSTVVVHAEAWATTPVRLTEQPAPLRLSVPVRVDTAFPGQDAQPRARIDARRLAMAGDETTYQTPVDHNLERLTVQATPDYIASPSAVLARYGPYMTAAAWQRGSMNGYVPMFDFSSAGSIEDVPVAVTAGLGGWAVNQRPMSRIERINRRANGTLAYSAPEIVEQARRAAEAAIYFQPTVD